MTFFSTKNEQKKTSKITSEYEVITKSFKNCLITTLQKLHSQNGKKKKQIKKTNRVKIIWAQSTFKLNVHCYAHTNTPGAEEDRTSKLIISFRRMHISIGIAFFSSLLLLLLSHFHWHQKSSANFIGYLSFWIDKLFLHKNFNLFFRCFLRFYFVIFHIFQ